MKKNVLFIFAIILFHSAKSQTMTELRNSIKIPKTIEVFKVEKSNVIQKFEEGSIIKKEILGENNGVKYTIVKYDTVYPSTIQNIAFEKEEKISIGFLSGMASLKISEDKTFLHVNYWLNKEEKLTAGQTYKVLKREFIDKNTLFVKEMFDTLVMKTIKNDSSFHLVDSNPLEISEPWFQKSNEIIAVYEGDNISKYLVNKYDRSGDYRITPQNRQYLSAWRRKISLGAVTVPLKFRSGFSKDSISISDDFSANGNLGLFLGFGKSKYRVRYEKENFVELPEFGFSVGPFMNLSTIELDSLSTRAGNSPYSKDQKQNIGVLSTGLGLMLTGNNLSFGVFGGWDFGFGSQSKNWNFNNKFWIGFGLNYSITSFWKKD